MIWQCREQRFEIGRKLLVMGIVNVTPDSFSDGGEFYDERRAIDHGLKLIDDGADILDIGGESTRPGAKRVPVEEELDRILGVVAALAKKIPVSIDTMKYEVADRASQEGACIVNDVRGLRDDAMIEVCQRAGVGVILNHMQGTPATMQANPTYGNVVEEVDAWFAERIATLTAAGIGRESLCLDPGIGFGKTLDHTLAQLNNLKMHQRHGRPVCLGVSRKGFLGQITGRERNERLAATLAVNCFAVAQGAAQILRVHDVAEHRDAARLSEAITSSASSQSP